MRKFNGKSVKKNPGSADSDRSKKWAKKQASRRVRHFKKWIPDGGKYKILYERWDIVDCNWRMYSHKECKDWAEEAYGDCMAWNSIAQCNQYQKDLMIRNYWKYISK
jgi:hypothetical protein